MSHEFEVIVQMSEAIAVHVEVCVTVGGGGIELEMHFPEVG
jgi:hypothetical protein